MAKKKARVKRVLVKEVPHFTGSIDARIPSENVELSHRMADSGKWLAVSRGTDGALFHGLGNTEPLARRIAGLRTYEHLQNRAEGNVPNRTAEDIEAARAELKAELAKLREVIVGYNGAFPEAYPKEVVLIELDAGRELVNAGAENGFVAKWLFSPLLFLGGAFVEGIVGVYAERALAALEKFIGG